MISITSRFIRELNEYKTTSGLSDADMAEYMGCDGATYSRIINRTRFGGTLDIPKIESLSLATGRNWFFILFEGMEKELDNTEAETEGDLYRYHLAKSADYKGRVETYKGMARTHRNKAKRYE